jgi:hypothetical protein
MKKRFLRLILAGLFVLSVGVAGAGLAELASAAPGRVVACPPCQVGPGTCNGSSCDCLWSYSGYHCTPPQN